VLGSNNQLVAERLCKDRTYLYKKDISPAGLIGKKEILQKILLEG